MNTAACWTVPENHPAFAGHFPGNPILPGVVLLDTVMRTVAADTGISLDACTVNPVKFLHPAMPGDELVIRYLVLDTGVIDFEIATGVRRIAGGSIVPDSAA